MSNIEFPISAVLELTYRCNHRCVFCSCPWYAPNSKYPKGEELELEQWKRAIDRLFDLGVRTFSISGGEATLKDCMPQIVEYIREESGRRIKDSVYPIVLISNGLNMKDEYLQLFKRCGVHLSMSLPGYSTFQEHTGVDNADGVLEWFRKAKEMGIKTTVNVTVTRKNIHELFETISMGLISGASSLLLNRFLPGGRGLEHMDELMLSREQVNEMLSVAEEVLSLSGRYGSVGTEVAACAIRDAGRYERLSFGYRCGAAKSFFVIDPSGNVRTCNHSPRIVGHILKDPVIEDEAYWNMFAESRYKPAACRGCGRISECDCGCREVANILYGNPAELDTTIVSNPHLQ
jgi:radical SAM protein with 4Fe4S-binding SPASM domain